MAKLQALHEAGYVVLGNPEYYIRFGFKTEPSLATSGGAPGIFYGCHLASASPYWNCIIPQLF